MRNPLQISKKVALTWVAAATTAIEAQLRERILELQAELEAVPVEHPPTREVFAGNGHQGSQMPLSQNFGLGSATIVDTVVITWPDASGTTTVKAGVAVDQFIAARHEDVLASGFETGDFSGWSTVYP